MTRKVAKYGALGIIAMASTLHIAAASAGPCAREIAEFRSSLPPEKHGEPTFVGTAPQAIGAQLGRQPTRESVERAMKQAQAQIVAVLAQAEALDSEGKRSECRVAIAKAQILLNPGLRIRFGSGESVEPVARGDLATIAINDAIGDARVSMSSTGGAVDCVRPDAIENPQELGV